MTLIKVTRELITGAINQRKQRDDGLPGSEWGILTCCPVARAINRATGKRVAVSENGYSLDHAPDVKFPAHVVEFIKEFDKYNYEKCVPIEFEIEATT